MAKALVRTVPITGGNPYVGLAVWTDETTTWMALTIPYIDAIHVVPFSDDNPWESAPRVIRGNLKAPCRIATTPTGNLIVAEHDGNRLQELTTAGDTVRVMATDAAMFAVAVDASRGTILAGKRDEDGTDGRVATLDLASGECTGAACEYGSGPGQVEDVMGVAILPDGMVAVASKPNRLVVLLPEGDPIAELAVSTPGVHFVDVAVAGDLIVTTVNLCRDLAWVRLGKDAAGEPLLSIVATTPLPESVVGIATLGDTVYVLATDNVYVFQ